MFNMTQIQYFNLVVQIKGILRHDYNNEHHREPNYTKHFTITISNKMLQEKLLFFFTYSKLLLTLNKFIALLFGSRAACPRHWQFSIDNVIYQTVHLNAMVMRYFLVTIYENWLSFKHLIKKQKYMIGRINLTSLYKTLTTLYVGCLWI